MNATLYRRLIVLTATITLGLVMLGAYVRLSDAGLGCPDWPGCYGHLSPHHASEHIQEAIRGQGGEHGPVSMPKAWKEMVHRYIATGVGVLILAIAFMAWRLRVPLRQSPWLATALVGVVILQGLFGKWTVTLLLKPAIVTGHLIGGMLTLSLLVWLWQWQRPLGATGQVMPPLQHALLVRWARLALLAVVIQICLGGWVSTNYAALACSDLPTCQGQWWPAMNFRDGFHVVRELGRTNEGALLSLEALTAIHMAHRLWAVVAVVVVGMFSDRLRRSGVTGLGRMIGAVLLLQLCLGLANIWLSLPISIAVLHNGVAAILLGSLVAANVRLGRQGQSTN